MIVAIIPARYASTRFPGKALAQVLGKSMIRRVYEQVKKCSKLDDVVVATDDERIAAHVRSFGGKVVITSSDHASGTDRCHEALQQLSTSYEYVINVQGDEPFIAPEQVDELASVLIDGSIELATQMIPVVSSQELFDKGEVKIVLNAHDEALYFSRMPIPYLKGVPEVEWHTHHRYYRHVGMYAYRRDVLEKIAQLPVSALERAESLEQLRWLENGFRIRCVATRWESHCIDTPEDLERVSAIYNGQV
jgi:3-deoxy-manno-octulosonate cytidylyltransferase (CMP-KDO synthetase)